MTVLTETSPELLKALSRIPNTRGADALHTGGGVMVAALRVGIAASSHGREVWLTRDDDAWLLGFYNFADDPEDEGVAVTLNLLDDDDPQAVADAVAGILRRVGA
jgi:hypothetical protein